MLLVSDPMTRQIMRDVEAGKVYTLKQVATMLGVSKEKARTTFTGLAGVFQVGHEWRVPKSIFDGYVLDALSKRAA